MSASLDIHLRPLTRKETKELSDSGKYSRISGVVSIRLEDIINNEDFWDDICGLLTTCILTDVECEVVGFNKNELYIKVSGEPLLYDGSMMND